MENLKNLIETHTCNMGGIRSGRSKSNLTNIIPPLLAERRIVIATTSKERAENIVDEISRYGLNIDYNHVYEKRKYKHTIVSLKNK